MSDDYAEQDGPEVPSPQGKAVAAAYVALIGTAVGGLAGGVVGAALAPMLEPAVIWVFDELGIDTRRRAQTVLAVAAETTRLSVDDLVAAVVATERTRLLAGTAIEAATRTVYEAKVRSLGRALADGVMSEDDARIDEQQLLVAALADVEPPHLSLLELITRWFFENGAGRSERFDPQITSPDGVFRPGPRQWTAQKIVRARPQLEPVLPVLTGALLRHGLVAEEDRVARALENYGKEYSRKANDALGRGRTAKAVRLDRGTLRAATPEVTWAPPPPWRVVARPARSRRRHLAGGQRVKADSLLLRRRDRRSVARSGRGMCRHPLGRPGARYAHERTTGISDRSAQRAPWPLPSPEI